MTIWMLPETISSKDFIVENKKDPKIIGMERRKENLTHSSLFIPNNLAVDIVTPDLETPGKIAIAWPMPTIKAIR